VGTQLDSDNSTIAILDTTAANLIEAKRFSEAIPVIQSLIQLDKNNWGVFQALGVCYANLEDYPHAIDAYTQALKLHSNDADLWNLRGVAFFGLKQYNEAKIDFNQALSINPGLRIAQENLQNAENKLNRIPIISFVIIIFLLVIGVSFILGTMAHQDQTDSVNSNQAKLISQAIDYRNTVTINYARELVQKSSAGNYNLAQVCDIWEYINKNWKYVNDPNGPDYYSPASNTINNGLTGDCDDFAILISAMVEAIGGTSRIVTATNDKGDGHAYAEVYIGTSQNDVQKATDYICTRYSCDTIWTTHITDDNGVTRYWLNLDWSAGHPGGPFTATNKRKYYYPSEDTEYVPIGIPEIIINNPLSQIQYNHIKYSSFSANSGDSFQISVSASNPVDVLIFDQNNFKIYQKGFTSGSAVSFRGAIYKSIKSKEITYVAPNSGTYYIVIENSDFLSNGADAKTTVVSSVKIILANYN